MPLYEYKCEQCGDIFEVMQKFSDKPLVTHEKCGGAVHRLISAPALQFKGSGWYVNDYAKGSGGGPNGASKKEDSGKKDDSGSKSSSSESSGTSSTPSTTSTGDKKSSS